VLIFLVHFHFIVQIASVSCSAGHAVAVLEDGRAAAWGSNTNGETKVPAAASQSNAVLSALAGDGFSVYLLKDGRLLTAGKKLV
jgi:alpha-tubulin suppressor-like RCC1 family protein